MNVFIHKVIMVVLCGIMFGCGSKLVAMYNDQAGVSSNGASSVSACAVGVVAQENLCPICLGILRDDDPRIVHGPQLFDGCSPVHVFHGQCIAKHLKTWGVHATCPLCRKPLYDAMANSEEVDDASPSVGPSAAPASAVAGVVALAVHAASIVHQPAPVASTVRQSVPVDRTPWADIDFY